MKSTRKITIPITIMKIAIKCLKKAQNHDSTGGHPSRNRHGKQIYFF